MYKKKGLGLLWAEKKETSRRLVLLTARQVDPPLFRQRGQAMRFDPHFFMHKSRVRSRYI